MKAPKAPKKPKRSASIKVWENFDKKMADHKKKVSAIEAAKKKKESLIKKYS